MWRARNMTGVAAGMAMSGKVVFTYSIANFPRSAVSSGSERRLLPRRERQDRLRRRRDLLRRVEHLAPRRRGPRHNALPPNLVVVAPGDPVETRAATRAVAAHRGPCYLRLGKAGEPTVHQQPPDFTLGKSIVFRPGNDLTLISSGGMLATAARAAELLAENGIDTRVMSMHTLKPLDTEALRAAAEETGALATLEEHSIIGGLGSAVADFLAELGTPVSFKRLGLPSEFSPYVGSQDYLLARHGLDVDSVWQNSVHSRSCRSEECGRQALHE